MPQDEYPAWTRVLRTVDQPTEAYTRIMESFLHANWAKTSVGPLESWSMSLRAHVVKLFCDTRPTQIFWGEDLLFIHNEAAEASMRGPWPDVMSQQLRHIWRGEDGTRVEDFIASVLVAIRTGKTFELPCVRRIFSVKDVAPQAEYVSSCIVPLIDDDGSYKGVYLNIDNHTREVLQQRNQDLLRHIEDSRTSSTTEGLCENLASAFENFKLDFPFVSMHSVTTAKDSEFEVIFQTGCSNEGADEDVQHDSSDQVTDWLLTAVKTRKHFWTKKPSVLIAGVDDDSEDNVLLYPFSVKGQGNSDTITHVMMIVPTNLRALNEAHESITLRIVSAVSSCMLSVYQRLEFLRTEHRFQALVSAAPIGIIMQNNHSKKINFVNSAWRELLQVDLAVDHPDFKTTMYSRIHPDSAEVLRTIIASTETGPFLSNYDIRVQLPRETKYSENWRKITITPLEHEIVTTVIDVSSHYSGLKEAILFQISKSEAEAERHRADIAVEQTKRHLEYIDYFSHELRNPLGAIYQSIDLSSATLQGLTEMLTTRRRDKAIATELKSVTDDIGTVLHCAQHMQKIMDDTLSFSQIQTGKLAISFVPVHLPTLLGQVTHMLRSECNVKRVQMTTKVDQRFQKYWLATDPGRLSQIMINLLTNSIKFSSTERQGRIIITVSPEEDDSIVFSVADNGRPITDVESSKLFQRFSQASSKTHIEYGGSGLGLHICKVMVELLGGHISARRNDMGGSTFVFVIKAEQISPPVMPDIDKRGVSAKSTSDLSDGVSSLATTSGDDVAGLLLTPSSKASLTKRSREDDPSSCPTPPRKHILVVEDNLINQKLMVRQLQKQGYLVSTANDGVEALEAFKSPNAARVPFDLCLCDQEMPNMDGLETVRQVKQYQRTNGQRVTPFASVSANARPEQVAMQLEAGMDYTISKPFGFEDLVRRVKAMLDAVDTCESSTEYAVTSGSVLESGSGPGGPGTSGLDPRPGPYDTSDASEAFGYTLPIDKHTSISPATSTSMSTPSTGFPTQ